MINYKLILVFWSTFQNLFYESLFYALCNFYCHKYIHTHIFWLVEMISFWERFRKEISVINVSKPWLEQHGSGQRNPSIRKGPPFSFISSLHQCVTSTNYLAFSTSVFFLLKWVQTHLSNRNVIRTVYK